MCGPNILRAVDFKTIYEFNTLIRSAGFLRLRDILRLRMRTLRHSVNNFRLQGYTESEDFQTSHEVKVSTHAKSEGF